MPVTLFRCTVVAVVALKLTLLVRALLRHWCGAAVGAVGAAVRCRLM
jgi:hypothetical protein